jgi:5'-phosphate synthase pdxT subunit
MTLKTIRKLPAGDGRQAMDSIIVGVLALQGDFREHIEMLKMLGVEAREIRFPGQLDQVDGLIIPGGESTTINKLFDKYGFRKKLHEFYESGKPLFGTCAGLIVLAKKAKGEENQLGLIDIDVERNAYGRQIDSFEQKISLNLNHSAEKKDFNSVYIRAPKIIRKGDGVKVLGMHDEEIVLARQENVLVSSFHPELTDDTRIHKYFIGMIREYVKEK